MHPDQSVARRSRKDYRFVVIALVTACLWLTACLDDPAESGLPQDERGVAMVVACADTVDSQRWALKVASVVDDALSAGERVELVLVGATPADIRRWTFPDSADQRSPSDAKFVDPADVSRARSEVADIVDSATVVQGRGLDYGALVEESVVWTVAVAGGRPARLVFICTGLHRTSTADITAETVVAVPDLELDELDIRLLVRFVGVGDFAGVQADVKVTLPATVRDFIDGICEQFDDCQSFGSLTGDLSELWSA